MKKRLLPSSPSTPCWATPAATRVWRTFSTPFARGAVLLPLKAVLRVSGATGPGARCSMSRTARIRSISSFGQAGLPSRLPARPNGLDLLDVVRRLHLVAEFRDLIVRPQPAHGAAPLFLR